jgi:Biotin-protein ligase, N terminal
LNDEEAVDVDESGIESARMSLRRSRRSARATIALAVVCVIAALVASYRSSDQEAADSSPRLALSHPSQLAQPPKPPPVEPLTAVESHELSLAAKARWPASAAEERKLIQALAKSAAVVRPIRAGIFNQKSCCDEPEPLIHILGSILSCTWEILSPEDVRSSSTSLSRFDVLVFPGGRAHKQADALGEEGRRAVKDFIRSGGGYVGICAGAFLASAQYEWSLGFVNTRTLHGDREMPGVGIRSMADRGPGSVQIELTPEGRSIFGDRSGPPDISFSGGPVFPGPMRDDLPRCIPLAHFSTELANYTPQRGTMIGTPAIFAATFGAGRVISISPHPETTKGAEFLVKLAVLATARTRANEPQAHAQAAPVPATR